jgi:hypothetical protein
MGKPGINIGMAITFPTMGSTFQAQKEIYKFKRRVPGEFYSRNVSLALNKISTF